MSTRTDLIAPDVAVTLDGLFHERVRRSPHKVAYRHFDDQHCEWQELTWSEMEHEIARWQSAMTHEGLQPGDRVALMLKNCPQWVVFDQAALGLGLVTVPLYVNDRPENVAHVLQDSGAKLLLIDNATHWHPLHEACTGITTLQRIVTLRTPPEGDNDERLRGVDEWLPDTHEGFRHQLNDPSRLATIVYTSGTTGKSKGVMLSHRNLISNAAGSLRCFDVYPSDTFLSFLPLSHCLERMAGYFVPVMAGATVAYARSVQQLQEDLALVRPTVLITVPRIFERIQAGIRSKLDKGPASTRKLFELAVDVGNRHFEHVQGRASWHPKLLLWPLLKKLVADKLTARLGGRLRVAISGGAALAMDNARTFIGLGLPILQGYGLSETSPVISVNRIEDNLPSSVGPKVPNLEVRLGEHNALEVRGPSVMMGYWNNETATRAMIADDGWLNTGDVASIDDGGRITITGRIKEIIVLSNGEKVPPNDMESAILADPLFEQLMVVGEGKAYLGLLAVVNRERWVAAMHERGLPADWPESLHASQSRAYALQRVTQQIQAFPGYARIRRVALLAEPWTPDNGLQTPTLKVKRAKVLERYHKDFEGLYDGY
ncbi:MAG: long-chain fatty acid--CoA ligase [Gammaproteobacteria bacterium]|nr:long-chain fatty acid--CoA ligase [Gammaproteobacteria bacterium]MBU1970114.1 long-chain fatty acid--CoA ligase [Gammaproteobacteria bacterium]